MLRLTGARPDELAHPLIDPARPIRFTLDGRAVRGFAGDTVLSALLASGIHTVGTREGHPVALTESFAPPVIHRGNHARPDLAVPMALCPAADGLDLVTLAPKRAPRGLARLPLPLRRRPPSLGIDLDALRTSFAPTAGLTPDRTLRADIAIVGGGLAGLSAAREAAERGLSAVLVEENQVLGGLARFFGRAEGDADPAPAIAELVAALKAAPNVTLLTATRATGVAPGRVDALGVALDETVPHPRRLAIRAERIVLATGSIEVLPVFPGNRLPGILLSSAAWSLARRFALWPGARTLIHSSANTAYRMALLAAECGMTVTQASDPRMAPQSRFIEFCKAYGFRLRRGTAIDSAAPSQAELSLTHRDAQTGRVEAEPEIVDGAFVSGGFLPDLALWAAAGGAILPHPEGYAAGSEGPDGIALAGAAAGFQSHTGAMESGRAAVARLLGETPPAPSDVLIDPVFETPQALPPASNPTAPDRPPAYFGAGPSLAAAAKTQPARKRLFRRPAPQTAPLDREPFALGLDDCIGKLASGDISADHFARLVAERCVPPTLLAVPLSPADQDEPPLAVPSFLQRRFGAGQQVWSLATADGRRLDPGALIYPNTDRATPRDAIGAVLGRDPDRGTLALLGPGHASGDTLHARDMAAGVAVTLGEKVRL